ncbi:sulfotransferase [Dolichospermum sp. UHCC 0259]|uniref:sulfotransferase family protein n=1 Tax=Dolichospermum sp. UHCC 0259 TaxID=2590010 RepID=UPI001C2DC3F5|nr:sulfotransferase [Dolichospermum sp. UHCC 0259]
MTTEIDLVNNYSDYCKFIVLGQGRSGSNFLLGLLNSHSQVIAYGELFGFQDIDWSLPKYNPYSKFKTLVSLINKNPEIFLERIILRKYLPLISAVGFKILYFHAKGDSGESVWHFLQNRQDIKIIHLKRKNLLKSFLSSKKALITNEWVVSSQKGINNKPKEVTVSLDYQECLGYFKWTQASMETHDLLFANHQKIDVVYEDLSQDYESEMKRVQEFLELDYETLKPNTLKQSSLSLSESISNYLELKEKFQNTPWAIFFED